MNNLYAAWCHTHECNLADPFAFKCTASVGGADYIADSRPPALTSSRQR